MSALSDLILQDNDEVLARMLAHPFVTSLEQGTLTPGQWRRYLAYEGAFVQTAIGIFAHATAKAPDIDAQRWLIGVQHALANVQVPYFERLGAEPMSAAPKAVAAFDEGMAEIARNGDFLEIVTAMFAAEWMYWTWCRRAARGEIVDPEIREWVDLHAGDDFAVQALWLRDAIDRHGAMADRVRLSGIFGVVTELEIAFHHAPLSPGLVDA